MECRRAFEADLADFVANAGKAEWAEFRAHYPGCPACAAEVRAWTELHLLLGAGSPHPAEDRLLRYETERDALPPAERQAIAGHLAGCRSCADELRALHRFDFAELAPRRSVKHRPWSPAFPERVRRVVLHPAFAYALVLALLYPALVERRPSLRQESAPRADVTGARKDAAQAPPERKKEAVEHLRALGAESSPRERDVLARAAREEPAAPAPSAASRSPELEGRMLEKAMRDQPAWHALVLQPHAVPEIGVEEIGPGLELAIPVERGRAESLEVRVLDPAGRREVTERFALTGSEERVEMRVPSTWLLPGTYRVEARETFAFRVTP